jgi:glycine hydroxymethyltransferase
MLRETRKTDPILAELVDEELHRQEQNIEMIASESTVPVPVMELSGSVFTNKTLEGYPGARYQAGSHVADKVERLAIERAKELFQAEHVNVQTYSGSTANYSVFAAVLKPGDKILSMRLDQGGHLTHGSPANWMSGFYGHSFYGVDPETEQVDYKELEKIAREENPKLIIAGGSSYPRLIDYERIAGIAKGVGAYFMVDMAHIAGLVAAGVIPSPIPHADFVSSSTTKTFCSARSGMVFSKKEHAKLLDKGTFPGSLGSIHLHTMAAKAWSFKYASTDEFKEIMEQVVINARTLSRELEKHGFRIVSGGTDNHLLVVDLRGKGITGKVFQGALDGIGITVNKNLIPFDPEKPSITSGVRIGLTSVTQRGLKEEEIIGIAEIMNRVADNPKDENVLKECKEDAQKLIARFPLYPEGTFMD